MKRKFIAMACITSMLFSSNVFAGTYTISFIDSVTQDNIKDAVVSSFKDGSSISYSTNPTENGYELDRVEINNKEYNNKNGNISIDKATDAVYNINYIFNDTQKPILELRETPYYLYNSAATDPKLLFETITDNSGVENIDLKFDKPIDTKRLGMQEFRVIATDKSKNEVTIDGALEIVGSCRMEMLCIDGVNKKELKLPYIKGLNVGSSETISIPTLPKGYAINSIKIDNKDINSTSNTFTINDIEDKIYKVTVECKDTENPKLKLKSPLIFTKKQAVDYESLVEVTDNSDDLIAITGNIDTATAGSKKQGTITATDKSGNSSNLNISYDVLAENYYTLKSVDDTTNVSLGIANTVAQKFNVGDAIEINVPETSNGYQLVSVTDATGATYSVIGDKLRIDSEDKEYALIAKYKDVTPPTGIAKTGLIFSRGDTIPPESLVTGLSDNSKGDIKVTYSTTANTNTIGNKTASVILTDKAGNSSSPINVSFNIIYGGSGEKVTLKVKYIDYDDDEVVETKNIDTYYGEVLEADDLEVPDDYKIKDKDWKYTVDKDDAIKVYVKSKEYTLSIRYVDEHSSKVVKRQTLTFSKGDKITEADLNIPSGYYISGKGFNKTMSDKDETVDIKVTDDDDDNDDNYYYYNDKNNNNSNNNNNNNNNDTSKDFKVSINYYSESLDNIIDTQVIYRDKNDTITYKDLNIPSGYELANSFQDMKVTSAMSKGLEIRKSKEVSNCTINYICNGKTYGTETKSYKFGEVIPEKELKIPEGFSLANKAEIKSASNVTVEIVPKNYVVHIVTESPEKTDYVIPEYKTDKYFNEINVMSKNANSLNDKEISNLGVVLKKYGADIYINDTSKWVVGSNIISFKDNKFEVQIPKSGKHIKYLSGYEDGTIKANSHITRAESIGILYTFLAKKDVSYEEYLKNFKDAKLDTWYSKYVGWGVNTTLIKGYPDNSIRPEGNITKAEFCTLISQIKTDLTYENTNYKYTDITKHWAKNYIEDCSKKGFFKVTNGKFNPDSLITRGEVVYAINRLFGRTDNAKSITTNPFKDLKTGDTYYSDLLEATAEHSY